MVTPYQCGCFQKRRGWLPYRCTWSIVPVFTGFIISYLLLLLCTCYAGCLFSLFVFPVWSLFLDCILLISAWSFVPLINFCIHDKQVRFTPRSCVYVLIPDGHFEAAHFNHRQISYIFFNITFTINSNNNHLQPFHDSHLFQTLTDSETELFNILELLLYKAILIDQNAFYKDAATAQRCLQ